MVDRAAADATPQERFEALVDGLSGEPNVTAPGAGAGFGAGALRVDNKIFAMLVRDHLVVKLPKARVDALAAAGQGVRFDANKGTPMREWLTLDPACVELWESLAHEALAFVGRRR
ncbi:hypothetical protein ACFPIJ_42330 [Dactylosporangium cerinum]|uniref:TfoX N-terminal domain-containing protein n=1 Tax=Dactylosporangium cerinum TaxID=1434730 RepID=A0ABV9W6Y1_9ACTN